MDPLSKFLENIHKRMSSFCDDHVVFPGKGYKPYPFSKSNFHVLGSDDAALGNPRIAFIDGGNSEIISSPSFSLQLVRVYYTIYQDNKRTECKRLDSYLLCHSRMDEHGEIVYDGEIIPDNADAADKQGKDLYSSFG